MTPENSNSGQFQVPATSSKTKLELLDEIRLLRKNLARAEADHQSTKELHQILSRAINIGYWEWDETTKRSAYFSEEMAGILGVSLESLYEIIPVLRKIIYPFVHPDDLEHYNQ